VVSSLNPSPVEDLVALAEASDLVLTIEAHYREGGLGSLVAEVMAERGTPSRLVRCAVGTMPSGISGSREFMLDRFGLSPSRLADRALEALNVATG
jgi:transketolase